MSEGLLMDREVVLGVDIFTFRISRLHGESTDLQNAMTEAFDHVDRLVLDLAEVEFLDSSFIGLLARQASRLRGPRPGTLPRPEVFPRTVWPICDDRAKAIERLQTAAWSMVLCNVRSDVQDVFHYVGD